MADEILAEHGGKIAVGFLGGLMAILKWMIGREIQRVEDIGEDHEQRIRGLEINRVTKVDIESLSHRMDTQHGALMSRIDELFGRIK